MIGKLDDHQHHAYEINEYPFRRGPHELTAQETNWLGLKQEEPAIGINHGHASNLPKRPNVRLTNRSACGCTYEQTFGWIFEYQEFYSSNIQLTVELTFSTDQIFHSLKKIGYWNVEINSWEKQRLRRMKTEAGGSIRQFLMRKSGGDKRVVSMPQLNLWQWCLLLLKSLLSSRKLTIWGFLRAHVMR